MKKIANHTAVTAVGGDGDFSADADNPFQSEGSKSGEEEQEIVGESIRSRSGGSPRVTNTDEVQTEQRGEHEGGTNARFEMGIQTNDQNIFDDMDPSVTPRSKENPRYGPHLLGNERKETARPKQLRGEGFKFIRPRGRSLSAQMRTARINQGRPKRGRSPTPNLNLKNLTPIRIDTSQNRVGRNPNSKYPEPAIFPRRNERWNKDAKEKAFLPMKVSLTTRNEGNKKYTPRSQSRNLPEWLVEINDQLRCSFATAKRILRPIITIFEVYYEKG